MTNKIDLLSGKYTVIDELSEGGGFRALRYGEEWRDLTGDQLVYSMFCEIERLRNEIKDMIEYANIVRQKHPERRSNDYDETNHKGLAQPAN